MFVEFSDLVALTALHGGDESDLLTEFVGLFRIDSHGDFVPCFACRIRLFARLLASLFRLVGEIACDD